jgi:hypothetical protein
MSAAFSTLAHQLPSLRARGAPLPPREAATAWEALPFLRWLCTEGLSHGELLAARLVLGVWNPDTDWVAEAREAGLPYPLAAKRFDALEAATVWDREHLEALAAWLAAPNKFP